MCQLKNDLIRQLINQPIIKVADGSGACRKSGSSRGVSGSRPACAPRGPSYYMSRISLYAPTMQGEFPTQKPPLHVINSHYITQLWRTVVISSWNLLAGTNTTVTTA